MWFLYCFIYWLLGVLTIYWMASKSAPVENPAWVIAYAFGPFLWPIIIYKYLIINLIK